MPILCRSCGSTLSEGSQTVRTFRAEDSVIALSFGRLQQTGLEAAAQAQGVGIFSQGGDAERNAFFDGMPSLCGAVANVVAGALAERLVL